MTSAKRVVEIVLAFTAFASALLLVWIASVFGLGLPIYLAATVGAWLLFAFVLPTLTGVFGPREVLAGIRARRQRKTHYEGELLPDLQDVRLGIRQKPPDSR